MQESYRSKIAPLFKIESPNVALQRLRAGWFSENVTKILKNAASGGALTGDAIVSALLAHRAGLLYGRIDMNRLRTEVENVRAGKSQPDAPRSLEMEVQAALDALGIPALPDIQSRLVAAATLRVEAEELRLLHVFWAMFFHGNIDSKAIGPTPR